jgi:chromosome segregation ATPase
MLANRAYLNGSKSSNSYVVLMQEGTGSEWQQVAADAGWSDPVDALQHKLTFAKRADAKAKVDALAEHVRRMRACGWHLHEQVKRLQLENAAVHSQLNGERAERAGEQETHEEVLRDVQAQLGETRRALVESNEALARQQAAAVELQEALGTAQEDGQRSAEEVERLRVDVSRRQEQLAELQEQVKQLTELQADAQRYNTQLQTFNARAQQDLCAANEALCRAQTERAEVVQEAAALRGRLEALEHHMGTLQQSSTGSEAARASALEDASRLRAELGAALAAREAAAAEAGSLREEAARLRMELDRWACLFLGACMPLYQGGGMPPGHFFQQQSLAVMNS